MSPSSSAPSLQICRTCGGGAPVDVHFCPQCSKLLTLGRHGDYFSFLGVPRKLRISNDDLDERFRALSRQFHPDYFYNATPAERRASLERSSYLNDAYRTLRDPMRRVEYLLQLEMPADAASRSQGTNAKVPASLLEEVFALNEELDEIRGLKAGGTSADVWKTRLEQARKPIEAKAAAHEAQLQDASARWDALVEAGAGADQRREVLTVLQERVLERSYINNLLEGIEHELGDSSSVEPPAFRH
jgi:molecular chaperone HscB